MYPLQCRHFLFICLSFLILSDYVEIECKPRYGFEDLNEDFYATETNISSESSTTESSVSEESRSLKSSSDSDIKSYIGSIPQTDEDKSKLYESLMSKLGGKLLFATEEQKELYSRNAFHNVLVGMYKLQEMKDINNSKPSYAYNVATTTN